MDAHVRRPRPTQLVAWVGAGLVVLLAAAGCADDNPGGSDTTATTEGVGAEELGSPNEASGSPIRVGFVNEEGGAAVDYSPLRETADAAIKYVNDYLGGVGGHPIELVHCANRSSPTGAADCANQMVEEAVAAVLVPITGQGATMVPILTDAGIPYVVYEGLSAEELTGPGAFSLAGGLPSILAAIAKQSSDEGFSTVSLLVSDVPALTTGAALAQAVFAKADVELTVIPVPLGAPDMTPQLATATDADAVGVLGDPAMCTSFLQGYETLGLTMPKFVVQYCLDPSVVTAVPGALDGAIVPLTTIYDPSSEEGRLYRAVLGKYAPDTDPTSNNALGYTTVLGFVGAVQELTGDVTAGAVDEAMRASADVPLPMSGGSTYTCDGQAIPLLPSVCSANVQVATVDADGVPGSPTTIDITGMIAL